MEEKKRGRGRPKVDTHICDIFGASRRKTVNEKYLFDGVGLLSEAATEIQDADVIWYLDDTSQTARSKNGILEQLGRMAEQDKADHDDCVYVANLAIAAVKAGRTSREIENCIRKIRIALKECTDETEELTASELRLGEAVQELKGERYYESHQ